MCWLQQPVALSQREVPQFSGLRRGQSEKREREREGEREREREIEGQREGCLSSLEGMESDWRSARAIAESEEVSEQLGMGKEKEEGAEAQNQWQ